MASLIFAFGHDFLRLKTFLLGSLIMYILAMLGHLIRMNGSMVSY